MRTYAGTSETRIPANFASLMKATTYEMTKNETQDMQIPTFFEVAEGIVEMSPFNLEETSPKGKSSKKEGSWRKRLRKYCSRRRWASRAPPRDQHTNWM
jgi:hypothetical protein